MVIEETICDNLIQFRPYYLISFKATIQNSAIFNASDTFK